MSCVLCLSRCDNAPVDVTLAGHLATAGAGRTCEGHCVSLSALQEVQPQEGILLPSLSRYSSALLVGSRYSHLPIVSAFPQLEDFEACPIVAIEVVYSTLVSYFGRSL